MSRTVSLNSFSAIGDNNRLLQTQVSHKFSHKFIQKKSRFTFSKHQGHLNKDL